MSITNEDRAAWALIALDAFARETAHGRSIYSMSGEEAEEMIVDLLCNIDHLIAFRRLSSLDIKARAIMHFEAEIAEEKKRDTT
jgi:hypothetical protein